MVKVIRRLRLRVVALVAGARQAAGAHRVEEEEVLPAAVVVARQVVVAAELHLR
jgi:hypothetical protein